MVYQYHKLQISNVLSALGKAVAFVAFGFMTPTMATAQNFMSQEELLATIPGGQVSGIANSDGKTRWVQAYSKVRRRVCIMVCGAKINIKENGTLKVTNGVRKAIGVKSAGALNASVQKSFEFTKKGSPKNTPGN